MASLKVGSSLGVPGGYPRVKGQTGAVKKLRNGAISVTSTGGTIAAVAGEGEGSGER